MDGAGCTMWSLDHRRGVERETVKGVGGATYDVAVGAESLAKQLSDLMSFHDQTADSMRTLACNSLSWGDIAGMSQKRASTQMTQ